MYLEMSLGQNCAEVCLKMSLGQNCAEVCLMMSLGQNCAEPCREMSPEVVTEGELASCAAQVQGLP